MYLFSLQKTDTSIHDSYNIYGPKYIIIIGLLDGKYSDLFPQVKNAGMNAALTVIATGFWYVSNSVMQVGY